MVDFNALIIDYCKRHKIDPESITEDDFVFIADKLEMEYLKDN
jgi:hypothetical protein